MLVRKVIGRGEANNTFNWRTSDVADIYHEESITAARKSEYSSMLKA